MIARCLAIVMEDPITGRKFYFSKEQLISYEVIATKNIQLIVRPNGSKYETKSVAHLFIYQTEEDLNKVERFLRNFVKE